MDSKRVDERLRRIINLIIQAIKENRRVFKDINDSIDTLGKWSAGSLEEQCGKLSHLS